MGGPQRRILYFTSKLNIYLYNVCEQIGGVVMGGSSSSPTSVQRIVIRFRNSLKIYQEDRHGKDVKTSQLKSRKTKM